MSTTTLSTAAILPITKTVYVILAPNGKGNEDLEIRNLQLTREEYDFIKTSQRLVDKDKFSEAEFDQLIANIDKRHKIWNTALKRAGIKGKRQIIAMAGGSSLT